MTDEIDMSEKLTWEDSISLNSSVHEPLASLGPVKEFIAQDDGSVTWNQSILSRAAAVEKDVSPLPLTVDREGYYARNNYNYWASGMRDLMQIEEWATRNGAKLNTILDIGCASGRLLRHVHYAKSMNAIYGCDINRRHVDWVASYLPPEIKVFQTTSLPHLPLPDSSINLVTAFSVFTHIEAFDTYWLMEIRRILKPGGVAWLTFNGDRIWRELNPTWPLWEAVTTHPDFQTVRHLPQIPNDRLVFRWHADRCYSANIFYRDSYIRRVWGRLLSFVEIMPALPHFQDVVVLQK